MPIPKKELKTLLQVIDGLTDTNNKSLCYAYSKYKATVAAAQLYDQIVLEGRWPECYQKVTVTEVRQIFVSKSVWHTQYIPCFQEIANHEAMVEWLEGNDNDEDVWGFERTAYHFSDFQGWLEGQKKLKKVMQKKKKTEEKVTKKKKIVQNKVVKAKK